MPDEVGVPDIASLPLGVDVAVDDPTVDTTPRGVCIYNINRGEVTSVYCASIASLLYHDATGSRHIRGYLQRAGTSSPSIVRSAGCSHFIEETNGEWMLWIDSDVEFPADTLDKMMEVVDPVAAPIVCGLYVSTLPDGLVGLAWKNEDDIYAPDELAAMIVDNVRLIPVYKTGAGFLMIHRDVLMTMYHANPLDPWFGEEIFDGKKQGEDFTFCIRANRCGYQVHVDLGVDLQHHKTIALHKGMLGNVFIETRDAGAVAAKTSERSDAEKVPA